jgi:hypothetical protein
MAGIVFLQTNNLQKIVDFYKSIGSKIWLDQGDFVILRRDNFLFGFCEREGDITKGWLLTFFYIHLARRPPQLAGGMNCDTQPNSKREFPARVGRTRMKPHPSGWRSSRREFIAKKSIFQFIRVSL